MRVSNIVKDYIRSEIEKKYPMDNLPEYENAKTRISEFEDEINSKLKAMVEDAKSTFLASNPDISASVLGDHNIRLYSVRRSIHLPPLGVRYRVKSDWELENDNINHLNDICKKREDTFNKIVVALELGGTKADLEQMLAELK